MRLISPRQDQSLTEYAFVLGAVSIILVAIVFLLGPAVGDLVSQIGQGL